MDMSAKATNYKATIDVQATADQVYKALSREMHLWWTTNTDGNINSEGDIIRVDFPPNNGHWTFEATTLVPGKVIELKCIDAHHVVAGQPSDIEKEWLGTTLRWHISTQNSVTKVEFEHHGLTPQLHCYEICHEGWNYFFETSFSAYLNTGKGMPHSGA